MEENKKIFIDETLNKFEERNGRLFIVEKSKSLAIEEVENILLSKNPGSILFITNNVFSAKELYNNFSKKLGEILLIDSFDAFNDAINIKSNASYEDYLKCSNSFIKKNSIVIISEKDSDSQILLHRKLCDNKSKNGVYNNDSKYAPFCISDFIAECKFDFVIINNIYDLLSNVQRESDIISANKNPDSIKPYIYDRIQLLNVSFYTDFSHSFKRLSNICHVATYCILLSDLIIDGQVIAFYMSLSLLDNDYSLIKNRNIILKLTNDYDADCNQICTDMSFCRNDDDILSNCIVLARQVKAKVSSDKVAMQKYFETEFSFMSDEEIFTKMFWAYTSISKKTGYSIDSIIDEFNGDNGTAIISNCFKKIFFVNDIKSNIESNIASLYVSEMAKKEVEFLMRIYKQYGIYHCPTNKLNSHVFMINRDDSGFDYYINKKIDFQSDKIINLSILGNKNDLDYKALLLSQIIKENKYARLDFPMLILANDVQKTIETIKKYIVDVNIYEKQSILYETQISDKSILVMSAEDFKDILSDLKLPYVIFFDIAFDTDTFSCIIDRLCMLDVKEVLVFATNGTLQGQFVNFWLKNVDILNGVSLPPIDITGYKSDRGNRCESSDIIRELDEIYLGFKYIATGKSNESEANDYADKLKAIINDYTLLSSCTAKETKNDMKFLTQAGQYFDGIFKNLYSVGGNGLIVEPTEKEKFEIFKKKNNETTSYKSKKNSFLDDYRNFEVPEEEKRRILIFNACSRLLNKTCDIKHCTTCSSTDDDLCEICDKYKLSADNSKCVYKILKLFLTL